MTIRGLCLGLAVTTGVAAGARADEAWRYVVPPAGDPFDYPPPRAMALSDTKPSDLKESVRYRGTRRRYGQLTYGTGRTAAIAVVVDEVSPTEVDLYVDADRDREITAENRVTGTGLTWRVEVAAVLDLGLETKEWPRTVLFRYGRASRTLGVATCGYYEGRVRLGYRDFPLLQIHAQAQQAAEASRCAGEQGKFWEYHDLAFANQSKLQQPTLIEHARKLQLDDKRFEACLASGKFRNAVQSDLQDGMKAGVNGTPAFYINGISLSGNQPASAFYKIIDEQLAALSPKQPKH